MFSFEYNITTNEHGRPIIDISDKTLKELDSIEHKFMALEMSRTIIETSVIANQKKPVLSEEEFNELKSVLFGLRKISDIFALTIKNQNALLNTVWDNFDVEVKTMDDLYKLNYNGFFYKDRIFSRKIGLRVRVIENGNVYELKDGIDNQHWVDVTKKE